MVRRIEMDLTEDAVLQITQEGNKRSARLLIHYKNFSSDLPEYASVLEKIVAALINRLLYRL